MTSNSLFEVYFSSKYIYHEDVVFHELDLAGRHRIQVNNEQGEVASYEEVAVNGDYLALSDLLSPTDYPIMMHLVGGKIEPVN